MKSNNYLKQVILKKKTGYMCLDTKENPVDKCE